MKKLMMIGGAVVAILSIEAKASTVAYWPLAGENGVRTTTTSVFENIVNPGTLDATAAFLRTSTAGINDTATAGAANYCPVGTNAFPSAYGVYDPVAQTKLTAATGLNFDVFSDWSGGSWWQSVVRVADPDALKLQTFTVEFFAQPDPARIANSYQTLAVMPLKNGSGNYSNGVESWSIWINGTAIYVICAKEDQTSRPTYGRTNVPQLSDGRWHHIAFTLDNKAFKLYVDYVLLYSGTLSNEIQYADDGDLFIGGTTAHKYPFRGAMAHFRISDEALTSDQFLHFTRTTRAEDVADDVVLHLDFEPVDGLSTNKTVVFNRAATGSAVHLHTSDNATYAGYAQVDTDIYTNKLYASRKDSKGYDNSMSYSKSASNTKYPYLAWYPDEDVFHDYSFTIEMFMKTATKSKWTPYLRRRVDPVASGAVQVTMATDGTAGHLSCGFASPRANGTVLLNEWQHLAFVYDRTAGSFSLFQNWAQVGSNTMSASSIGTATNTPITLFGDAGNDDSSFIGKLDEVRITKRALCVKEFLTPERANGLIIIFQ